MLKSKLKILFTIIFAVCGITLFFLTQSQAQSITYLFPILKDGKWGFINEKGEIIISPQFSLVGEFSEGKAHVRFGEYYGGKDGYIDTNGKIVVEPIFNGGTHFSEGFAAIIKKGKYGYIDKSGDIVIEPKFEDAVSFSDGLARVKMNGKYGYLDKKGKIIIPPQFFMANDFHCGFAAVMVFVNEKLKAGYINQKGNWVFESKFIYAGDFAEEVAIVGLEGETLLFDGKALAVLGVAKYAIINSKGMILSTYNFNGTASSFSDGMIAVRVKDKWGYLNEDAEFAIKPQFDEATDFSEGLASVQTEWKNYYIDKTGKTVIETNFWDLGKFKNGLAMVTNRTSEGDYLYGYIDKTGKMIWSPTK